MDLPVPPANARWSKIRNRGQDRKRALRALIELLDRHYFFADGLVFNEFRDGNRTRRGGVLIQGEFVLQSPKKDGGAKQYEQNLQDRRALAACQFRKHAVAPFSHDFSARVELNSQQVQALRAAVEKIFDAVIRPIVDISNRQTIIAASREVRIAVLPVVADR